MPYTKDHFYQELLLKLLTQYPMQISFPTLEDNPANLLELRCYQALRQIREILSNSTLSDAECFQQIEQIVCIIEELGSSAGERHDFS